MKVYGSSVSTGVPSLKVGQLKDSFTSIASETMQAPNAFLQNTHGITLISKKVLGRSFLEEHLMATVHVHKYDDYRYNAREIGYQACMFLRAEELFLIGSNRLFKYVAKANKHVRTYGYIWGTRLLVRKTAHLLATLPQRNLIFRRSSVRVHLQDATKGTTIATEQDN